MILFIGGLVAYLAGAIAGLASYREPKRARLVAFTLALVGALLQALAAAVALVQGTVTNWSLPCGVPLFSWTVRVDPLSAWFNLALGLVATAVSIYSSSALGENDPVMLS